MPSVGSPAAAQPCKALTRARTLQAPRRWCGDRGGGAYYIKAIFPPTTHGSLKVRGAGKRMPGCWQQWASGTERGRSGQSRPGEWGGNTKGPPLPLRPTPPPCAGRVEGPTPGPGAAPWTRSQSPAPALSPRRDGRTCPSPGPSPLELLPGSPTETKHRRASQGQRLTQTQAAASESDPLSDPVSASATGATPASIPQAARVPWAPLPSRLGPSTGAGGAGGPAQGHVADGQTNGIAIWVKNLHALPWVSGSGLRCGHEEPRDRASGLPVRASQGPQHSVPGSTAAVAPHLGGR